MRFPGPVRRILRRSPAVLVAVAVLLLVGTVVGVLPVRLMRVDTSSMTPTISPGDLLVVHSWAFLRGWTSSRSTSATRCW